MKDEQLILFLLELSWQIRSAGRRFGCLHDAAFRVVPGLHIFTPLSDDHPTAWLRRQLIQNTANRCCNDLTRLIDCRKELFLIVDDPFQTLFPSL